MAVFTLTCSSCGVQLDIPGRYGFKLKNAGMSTAICTDCRQKGFLRSRNDGISSDQSLGTSTGRRRRLPVLVLTFAVLLMVGLVWLKPGSKSPEDRPQEGRPETVSPSR